MQSNTLAQFNGHNLTIIEHQGRKWLTAEQAGRALGYNPERAGDSVNNLLGRHHDEFTELDSVDIKLMSTDGKLYSKRVFSDTGCNKLGFFANTAMAKQFRQFAAKTLAGQTTDPTLLARVAALEAELASLRANKAAQDQARLQANPKWTAIADLRRAGRDGAFIAAVLGMTRGRQDREVRNIRRAGLGHLLPAAALPPVGRNAGALRVQARQASSQDLFATAGAAA